MAVNLTKNCTRPLLHPSLSELCCQSSLLVTSCASPAAPTACDLIQCHYCTTHLTEAHIQPPPQASETAWPAGLKIVPLHYSAVAHAALRGFCRVMVLIRSMTACSLRLTFVGIYCTKRHKPTQHFITYLFTFLPLPLERKGLNVL